jgi:energy-coupling factor transporter ATP-binding protein EcfA2
MASTKRLPEVPTLSSILPKGSEGGKEFSRIVDLLLFQESRRNGRKVTIFNDAAGDYNGLDSFGEGLSILDGRVGYQYKFFPSPLTVEHRKSIISSLQQTHKASENSRIKKWILITPDDFVESSSKKDGGDVTWFENLKTEFKLSFELEHWGHKNLISLFIETPSLCLFYYPELIHNGNTLKNTILDTKLRYDENLVTLNKNIEFVGMSIYKPEATRGVPMEHIYIPLSVVPELADDTGSNAGETNPIKFLKQGSKTVILGDPGSGKSTLLRFLSLSGISKEIQGRYHTEKDGRIPIVIVLRRYADELKSRKNLSIVDFIQEYIQADFSLKSADPGFFNYFFESGRTIFIFDGLDELPDSNFKQIVRDRIRSLTTTYPGNTVIITSRIVGYDNPFRFDEKEYNHYRITKLKISEMEQFVKDWYQIRIESNVDREANIKDLVRILRDESHTAIRELAENPLLLTIVALVHRIDAILPDERVVLYQKCTETLLNTWHTWKYRDTEIRNKGRLERRNRKRMEAIAHWMHTQSTGVGKTQRSIVSYAQLLSFLTIYVSTFEKIHDSDNEPEDLASQFIEFIKQKAGLLVEVGDQSFSFLHLTFQEYLTSSYMITNSEKAGVASIWDDLKSKSKDPRWYEVVRLLVAGLKSDDSQDFILDRLLSEKSNEYTCASPMLLGGFLLDGVSAAEERAELIIINILTHGIQSDSADEIRSISFFIRAWLNKESTNNQILSSTFNKLWKNTHKVESKIRTVLFCLSAGLSFNDIINMITLKFISTSENDNYALKTFFSSDPVRQAPDLHSKKFSRFELVQYINSITRTSSNFISVLSQSVFFEYSPELGVKNMFNQFLFTLMIGSESGPHMDFNLSLLAILPQTNFEELGKIGDRKKTDEKLIDLKLTHLLADKSQMESNHREQFMTAAREKLLQKISGENVPDYFFDVDWNYLRQENTWQSFQTIPKLYNPFLQSIVFLFELQPAEIWQEALRINFVPRIPALLGVLFESAAIHKVVQAFKSGNVSNYDIYFASYQLLMDAWMQSNLYTNVNKLAIDMLIQVTQSSVIPQLEIAHIIRAIYLGDASKVDFLFSLYNSKDDKYDKIFDDCFWRNK